MENSIINSLKRLERVGTENSRVTEKLKNACCEVARKIVSVIKEYAEDVTTVHDYDGFRILTLPRNYSAIKVDTDDCEYWTIIVPNQDPYQFHPYDRSLASVIGDITREDALRFAKDIAEGLLLEIADFIEQETKQAEDAEKEIQQAVIEEIERR